jgi:PEP-CTERM motif
MTLGTLRIAAYAASIVIAASAASVANASVIFDLTSDHCTGGCGTAPFGTVELAQNGTSVDIVVALAAGYFFVKTDSADFQNFKFNGTGIDIVDITPDQTVPTKILIPTAGAFNGDGTGTFGFRIKCTDDPVGACANGGAGAFSNPISFRVANATIADLTVPNNLGNVFVAGVLAPNGNIGPVDATTPRPTPEPGSLLLFGTALAALGLFVGRRSKIL